jgi:hypothetical protein
VLKFGACQPGGGNLCARDAAHLGEAPDHLAQKSDVFPVKVVPSTVFKFSSSAERRVYEQLKKLELGDGWTAYHSLNCSEHEYKQWAEIDFLLLGPEGAFVFEVKGGRIRREEGIWWYRDRYDQDHRNNEGPFNQAKTAMYALREMLRDRYRQSAVVQDRLVFGWGVIFPDIDWEEDTPETPIELVADRLVLADPKSLKRYLKRVLEYWRKKAGHVKRADGADLKELQRRIRPDVDLYPPLTFRIGETLDHMQALTEEQYERVEILEQNDRAIVSGGAGTGKTYLLMQCARKEVARGRDVLVVVESPVLGVWLRSLESDPRIKIVTYRDLSASPAPADVLLVDEGQDLLSLDALVRLAEHVVGGFDKGRWRWFMDEGNQAGIAGVYSDEALQHLREGLTSGAPVNLPLRQNVRNTREVVRAVRAWTGAEIGRSEVSGSGREPKVVVVPEPEEVGNKLGEILSDLLEQGAMADEIGIILPLGMDPEFLRKLEPRHRRRLVPLDVQTVRADLRGKVVFGSVDLFKGLERPIVLCVGFDDVSFSSDRLPELYVAMTRANFGLYVFANQETAASLVESLFKFSEDQKNLEKSI